MPFIEIRQLERDDRKALGGERGAGPREGNRTRVAVSTVVCRRTNHKAIGVNLEVYFYANVLHSPLNPIIISPQTHIWDSYYLQV